MKKIFLLFAMVSLLAGCQRSDKHTARNSLDYQGTYEGTLPTASGTGMHFTLELGDSTYHKVVRYLAADKDLFDSRGKFTWNEAGNIITLTDDGKPNMYFVAENKLYHLDMNGKRIKGKYAELYALKKIK